MELLKAFIWEGWIPVSCDSMEEWICHSPQWQRSPDSRFHPWRHRGASFLQVCCAKQVNRAQCRAIGSDLENRGLCLPVAFHRRIRVLQFWDQQMTDYPSKPLNVEILVEPQESVREEQIQGAWIIGPPTGRTGSGMIKIMSLEAASRDNYAAKKGRWQCSSPH